MGLAVTIPPVEALNPTEGLHEKVFATLAVSIAELPMQIEGEFTERTGRGFTVT